MTTNLIQNYITNKPVSAPQPTKQAERPKKPMPNFDIQKELDTKTFVKPSEGKGRLLNESILSLPSTIYNDTLYNVKAFKHAVKGQANDHELGKLNDVGLLMGGLGIASYLATKRTTPLTKGMEFVGLGSFLASMAIWPKIAIQLPAYLVHGVNVQKQYEDSFGRKKQFYQDPQFIPWDLYSDEDIQKMGDRLGVEKNIPNRREAIQEKMKKLAIQNNTLWMLTAGFAAPVMSALICNQIEPYLAKYQDKLNNKKADDILANFDKHAKKLNNHTVEKEIATIVELNKNKPITRDVERLVMEAFTFGTDLVTADSIKRDIKQEFFTDYEYLVSEKTAKTFAENIQQQAKLEPNIFTKEVSEAVLPKTEDIIKVLSEKNLFAVNLKQGQLEDITSEVMMLVQRNLEAYNATVPKRQQRNLDKIQGSLFAHNADVHPIGKVFDSIVSTTLNPDMQSKLHNVARMFDDFNAKIYTLDNYAIRKVGNTAETVIANYWNNTSDDIMRVLGFTPKEIAKVRLDRNLMSTLLREKIEHLVADKGSYDKAIKTIIEKISKINELIKSTDLADGTIVKPEKNARYDELVDEVFSGFAESMKDNNIKFFKTSSIIANGCGTLQNIQKRFAQDRLLGVKSSFYRIINTLDYYRRIAEDPNSMPALNGLSKETKEELVELGKIFTLEGHSSDSANKFYMLRNPNPASDMGPLVVKDGKVQNQYYGKAAGMTDIPNDKYFYQKAMQIMFENNMHPDTLEALKGTSIEKEIASYRDIILTKIGGDQYFVKPEHLIRPANRSGSDVKFLLTGIAPDEFFFKAGQKAFNTRKWLTMFGGFGAALLGVTVLAQFFFGKTKSSEKA